MRIRGRAGPQGWRTATILLSLDMLLVASAVPVAAQEYDWRPGEGFSGTDGPVYATVTWDPDGPGPQPERLVVGGYFTLAGDVVASYIATRDGTSWQLLGSGMNQPVRDLTLYNGELVAGGGLWGRRVPGWPQLRTKLPDASENPRFDEDEPSGGRAD